MSALQYVFTDSCSSREELQETSWPDGSFTEERRSVTSKWGGALCAEDSGSSERWEAYLEAIVIVPISNIVPPAMVSGRWASAWWPPLRAVNFLVVVKICLVRGCQTLPVVKRMCNLANLYHNYTIWTIPNDYLESLCNDKKGFQYSVLSFLSGRWQRDAAVAYELWVDPFHFNLRLLHTPFASETSDFLLQNFLALFYATQHMCGAGANCIFPVPWPDNTTEMATWSTYSTWSTWIVYLCNIVLLCLEYQRSLWDVFLVERHTRVLTTSFTSPPQLQRAHSITRKKKFNTGVDLGGACCSGYSASI